MIRILRAFAWLRWRVLINSFERTGARDTLERLSLAVDQIGPIIAALLLVPSLVGMSGLSAYAGYALATNPQRAITFEVLRFLTLAITGFAIIGPIVLPVMERANPVRLLLLPIPRATLYFAQASGALADPWTLVLVPVTLFLPLGLAIGGAPQAAALALAGGLTLLVIVVGLSTLTACLVQLVLRDRRRGELVALAFILIFPLIGMLSSGFGERTSRRSRQRAPAASVDQPEPSRPTRLSQRAFALTPSERYVAVTRAGVEGRPAAAASAWLLLVAMAALLHGAGMLVFQRLLAFPGSVSRRRSSGDRAGRRWRIPGIAPGASAVAIAQLRLVLRTPRGRSTLLSPLLVFIVMAVAASRGASSLVSNLPHGAVLAAVGAFFSVLSTLPLMMNQFAIDGAGLTLELLSPLSDDDLLNGKAVANAMLGGVPALLCMMAAFALLPGGSAALWVSVPLAVAGMSLILAPAAAALSAVFPRVVDLNSVGRGSNAHGVAGLAGIASVACTALPPTALAFVAIGWLRRPELTPLLLLAWCAIAFAVNRLLARPVRALLARRRENLSLVTG